MIGTAGVRSLQVECIVGILDEAFEGIAAAKSGHRERARSLLTRASLTKLRKQAVRQRFAGWQKTPSVRWASRRH